MHFIPDISSPSSLYGITSSWHEYNINIPRLSCIRFLPLQSTCPHHTFHNFRYIEIQLTKLYDKCVPHWLNMHIHCDGSPRLVNSHINHLTYLFSYFLVRIFKFYALSTNVKYTMPCYRLQSSCFALDKIRHSSSFSWKSVPFYQLLPISLISYPLG